MKKQVIKLTEGDLHRIIENSVKKCLNELDWRTMQSAKNKAIDQLHNVDDLSSYEKARRRQQIQTFNNGANERLNSQYGLNDDEVDNARAYYQYQDDIANGDSRGWTNPPKTPSRRTMRQLDQRDKDVSSFLHGHSHYQNGNWQND